MSSTTLLVRPQKSGLQGTVTVPGDKSISHRAVLLAAIADGESTIRNWLPAGDTLATLDAVRALGVAVEVDRQSPQAWDLRIAGRGLRGLRQPEGPLDCRNAGTCMRLLAGILSAQRFPSVLDGSEQLRRRPMRRITMPLQQMGAKLTSQDGRAPLHITPADIDAITVEMAVASAQVKSAIILAGLYAGGETRVFQPGPARDHTERMLQAMGVGLESDGEWIKLAAAPNGRTLAPLNMTVPGDISSAAFLLVAASIVPHSAITIRGVGLNPTRTGILDMLRQMGGEFHFANERTSGGEPVADLTASFGELHGADVSGDTVVRGIDEFPAWAVAATQAAGDSTVSGAAELRVKEVDRIRVLANELRKFGAAIAEHEDGFTVSGPSHLYSAEVDSHDDHRLAMSMAVAGLVTRGPTLVKGAACARDSFPGFVETLQQLGADVEWAD